jgi:hypothetical protein
MVSGTASTMTATRPCRAAVSDSISVSVSVSNPRFSRLDRTAMPWSPIVPLTRLASPCLAKVAGDVGRRAGGLAAGWRAILALPDVIFINVFLISEGLILAASLPADTYNFSIHVQTGRR